MAKKTAGLSSNWIAILNRIYDKNTYLFFWYKYTAIQQKNIAIEYNWPRSISNCNPYENNPTTEIRTTRGDNVLVLTKRAGNIKELNRYTNTIITAIM